MIPPTKAKDYRNPHIQAIWYRAEGCRLREDLLAEGSKRACEGCFDYLLVESTGISEPPPVVEPRLGRRTVLTVPLFPPPQKN